ncbi:MAG: hypothetical protein LAO09_23640, partial [Acidobacteriia bacterium]|nr:hypothetical protein [Terriglobia bacterium]
VGAGDHGLGSALRLAHHRPRAFQLQTALRNLLRGQQAGACYKDTKGEEDLHLVTYHIPSGKYTDHGAVYYEGGGHPSYVNSIAVGKDGTVYTLARVPRPHGEVHVELISFKPAAM